MKLPTARRKRPTRPLPAQRSGGEPGATGPRTLLCVDLRAVDSAWSQRSLEELRHVGRGGRLGALFAEMDMDPRYPLSRNVQRLPPVRIRRIFEALCEELAELVLYDVPETVWRPLLPMLCPDGHGLSPYPKEAEAPAGEPEALVLLAEGRIGAETAALLCSRTPSPPTLAPTPTSTARPGDPQPLPAPIDPELWAYVMQHLLPMLDAVRDRSRALLMESI